MFFTIVGCEKSVSALLPEVTETYEEESKRVDGAKAGHANEHEDVDLPVLDRLPNVLHVKIVGKVTVVRFKAALNLSAFLVGKEAGAEECQVKNL